MLVFAVLLVASGDASAQANLVGPGYCSNNCGVETPQPDGATDFELGIMERGKPAGLTYRICNRATRRCADYQRTYSSDWNGTRAPDVDSSPGGGVGDGNGGAPGTGGNWGGIGLGAGACFGRGCFGEVGPVRPIRPH